MQDLSWQRSSNEFFYGNSDVRADLGRLAASALAPELHTSAPEIVSISDIPGASSGRFSERHR